MALVLGWVSVAPWHGLAWREASPQSKADVLGLRHPENTSCWQQNATMRVKVKSLAACIPLGLSQSGIKKKSPNTKTPFPSSLDGKPCALGPRLWFANSGDPVVPGGTGGSGQAPMLGCS